jgi:hypothetical protein
MEFATPVLLTQRLTRVQMLPDVTDTVNCVEALLVRPARSVADALSVLVPTGNVYASPEAPGHVLVAIPDMASVTEHVIAMDWSTV